MTEPLPVDVVQTWWDYFVDAVGVVSGLATAGALLIAALAYSQQVRTAFHQQAAKIVLSAVPISDGGVQHTSLKIVNTSDQPIRLMECFVLPTQDVQNPSSSATAGRIILDNRERLPRTLVANETLSLALIEDTVFFARVHFMDAGRCRWWLEQDGRLKKWSRLKWLKHRIAVKWHARQA